MKNEEILSSQKARFRKLPDPRERKKLVRRPWKSEWKVTREKKRALRNKEKLYVRQRNMATHGGKRKSAKILNRITTSGFHF